MSGICPVCGSGGARELWQDHGAVLVRCPACQLAYVADPPGPEELKSLYSFESGFHTQLEDAASRATLQADRAAAGYLDLMDSHQRPGALLDVGCATGRFMRAAAARGWTAQGVELNEGTASIARRDGLDVTTGTLDDLDVPEGSLDAVTMWDLIEHVPDPVGLLRSVQPLLRRTGLLWLATPNIDGLFPRASLRVAGRVGRWPHPDLPHHLFQFSETTMRDALARAGFTTVVVEHRRIPLSYTFGTPRVVLRDPKRLAYTMVFAPVAAVGPLVRRGDTMIIAATPS